MKVLTLAFIIRRPETFSKKEHLLEFSDGFGGYRKAALSKSQFGMRVLL